MSDQGEVHVWCARLDVPAASVERLKQILSSAECQRAARYRSERTARHFVLARGILRAILGFYAKTDPRKLIFGYGALGKPALADESGEKALRFNLSHSGEIALFAIARQREVGVDVERRRTIASADKIVERFFSASERNAFQALPADERQEAFLRAWTCKEAYIKGHGEGFSLPFDRFDVSLAATGEPERVNDRGGFSDWFLWKLDPASDYFGAVAVEGSGGPIKHWRWKDSLLIV